MFGSRLLRPATIASPIGNGERGVFEERIENGLKRLVKISSEDLKEIIEASKAETMIDTIIARYNRTGDASILHRVQGFYADATTLPSNLMDAQNQLIKMRNQFDTFPVDIKNKFGNSFDNYVNKVSHMTIEDFTKHFNLEKKVSEDEALLNKDVVHTSKNEGKKEVNS